MTNNINSDNIGPGMGLKSHVSSYATFTATVNSADGPHSDINGNGDRNPNTSKGKCGNRGNTDPTGAPCQARLKKPAHTSNAQGGGDLTPTRDNAGGLPYCMQGSHTEADCHINGNPPHKDSKLIPRWSVGSAALSNVPMTTKDPNVEQFSNVFKGTQSGSTELPMGLVANDYTPRSPHGKADFLNTVGML